MRKPSGGVTWVKRQRRNDFLDAEALAYAAAYMLGVQRLKQRSAIRNASPVPASRSEDSDSAPTPSQRRGKWLGERTGWLNR